MARDFALVGGVEVPGVGEREHAGNEEHDVEDQVAEGHALANLVHRRLEEGEGGPRPEASALLVTEGDFGAEPAEAPAASKRRRGRPAEATS